MKDIILFPSGITKSCRYAADFLERNGFSLIDHLSPDITHLLLDIPTFDNAGNLRDRSSLQELLTKLPQSITVIGGNLNEDYLSCYPKIDLLKINSFLASNAAITAECALQIAASYLPSTFADSPTLILGWGRIGKCLSKLLHSIGCNVTVAARSDQDRSMIKALGYHTCSYSEIPQILSHYKLLFNTVPEQTVDINTLNHHSNVLKIDLASSPGMKGTDVITARGLPGKYAPETTGKLIAKTILHSIKEVRA